VGFLGVHILQTPFEPTKAFAIILPKLLPWYLDLKSSTYSLDPWWTFKDLF